MFEERAKTTGITLSSQIHQLPLISVPIKPQMQTDQRIENYYRIVRSDLFNRSQSFGRRVIAGCALAVAQAVYYSHCALIPPRGQVGAGCVGEVVWNLPHPLRWNARQPLPNFFQERTFG